MKNFGLNSNDEVHQIIKRPPKLQISTALPGWKQSIFCNLHELSGEDYQAELKKVKCHWVRKTKLSSD